MARRKRQPFSYVVIRLNRSHVTCYKETLYDELRSSVNTGIVAELGKDDRCVRAG